MGKQTTESALKYADLVVKGKIVSVTNYEYYDTLPYTLSGYKLDSEQVSYLIKKYKSYTLIITDKYKTVTGTADTIQIITGFGGGDCGYNFEIGKDYIVYGDTWKEDTIAVQQKKKKQIRKLARTIIPNTFYTYICMLTQIANIPETERLRQLTQ